MSGHKLTIKGQGMRAIGYDVTFDGKPLHCTAIKLEMGVDDPTTATITVLVDELDTDIEAHAVREQESPGRRSIAQVVARAASDSWDEGGGRPEADVAKTAGVAVCKKKR